MSSKQQQFMKIKLDFNRIWALCDLKQTTLTLIELENKIVNF